MITDSVSPGDTVWTDDHIPKVVCGVDDHHITVMWGDNNRQKYTRAEITMVSRVVTA